MIVKADSKVPYILSTEDEKGKPPITFFIHKIYYSFWNVYVYSFSILVVK